MNLVAWIISVSAAFLLAMSALALLRAKDVFAMTHIAIINNCYFVSLLLIGFEFNNFSWLSLAKIGAIILLNLIISNLVCHLILKRAMLNKITPDAETITTQN